MNTSVVVDETPFYLARCPVCGGHGSVNWGKQTCHACKGKGYLQFSKETEKEKLYEDYRE